MRRIKMMLAVVSAVATMAAMASPAMAQTTSCCGDLFIPNVGSSDGLRVFGVSNVGDDFDDLFDDGDAVLFVRDDGDFIPVVVDDDDFIDGQSFGISGLDSGTVVGGISNTF